ncbi:MAG TPA: AMP-binding protein [Gammaproteobacteria bacterium]
MALLHKGIYHGIQLLRGRPTVAYMHKLAQWDALEAHAYAALCERRLARALEHAKRHVPLYSTGPWRSLPDRAARDIRDWPVLERRVIGEERDRLLTDAAGGWGRPSLHVRRSSGSTGAPVEVVWDSRAMAWSWAAEYHPMRWHGLGIGVKTLRIWGSAKRLENWVLNRRFVRTDALTTEELDKAYRYLVQERPTLVWGVPSAVAQLARYVAQRPAERRLVPFAKVGGEQVYEFQREEIRRGLGARVIEAYGCTEVGPIAAECPLGSMHVLATNVLVEVFRGDEPLPVGEHGDLVLTTLVNRGMPLVRCRVGDSGRLSPERCACGLPLPVLTDLRGRNADMLLAVDGTPVHGSALGQALHRYRDKPPLARVRQILFEQMDERRWTIQVESEDGIEKDTLSRQVTELLQETFGSGCSAEIRVVPTIPREPSGKYRYYRAAHAVHGSRDQRVMH